MTLRRKTIFIVGITLVTLMAIFYVVSKLILYQGFSRIEDNDMRRNVMRVVNAFNKDIIDLNTKLNDWSAWDDTYRFIVDKNREYSESNLLPETFYSLKINYMIFVNINGQVVYSRGFDFVTKKEIIIPPAIYTLVCKDSELLNRAFRNVSTSGIVNIPGGTVALCIRPIVTSQEKLPVRGALIAGINVDRRMVSELSETTQLSVRTIKWDSDSTDVGFKTTHAGLSPGNPIFIKPVNDNVISGYALIQDLFKMPALIIRVDVPRDIMAQERRTTFYLLLFITITGFVFGLIIIFLLEKSILLRLLQFSRNVTSIGSNGAFSDRVTVSGQDELSSLGVSVNLMLDALEDSHEKIKKRNHQMRMIMDTVPIGLLSIDEQYAINPEYSISTELIFGIQPPAGKKFTEFIGEVGVKADDINKINEYFELFRGDVFSMEEMADLNPCEKLMVKNHKTGRTVWIKTSYYMIHRNIEETERNILVFIEDITDEKELAEQVSSSEKQNLQLITIAENTELFKEFLIDTRSSIGQVMEKAEILSENLNSAVHLEEAFREVHTIKGTAGVFGAGELSEAASKVEDILSSLRGNWYSLDDVVSELRASVERLLQEFRKVENVARKILGDTVEENDVHLNIRLLDLNSCIKALAERVRCKSEDDKGFDLEYAIGLIRSLRMITARKGFARAIKIAEGLIRRNEKNIEIEFINSEEFIDCEVARELNTPLIHLFRNTFSHGIENPLTRLENGKPEIGVFSISIDYLKGMLRIEIADNGRGIDKEMIKQCAIEKNFITPEEANSLTPQDCYNLIFKSGFSTQETVTDTSGRGVGMDAVVASVKKLNGEITLDTTPGKGTTFSIIIPVNDV